MTRSADRVTTDDWEARLARWLRVEQLTLTPIAAAGHTNAMYVVAFPDGSRQVLRMPPPVKASETASNVGREFRVLTALEHTSVPHAAPISLCDDVDVLGRPFLLTAFVDGFKGLPEHFPAPFTNVDAHRELAFALIDALAAIHAVPWEAVELADYGRPTGFLDRQVDRWMRQLQSYQFRDLPHLDAVCDWLRSNRPSSGLTGLMHGDFSSGNVLFATQRPGTVAAVVDWENSTIGDPALDLAGLLRNWPSADEQVGRQRELADGDHHRLHDMQGIPTRNEMLARWSDRTGWPIPDLRYYDVLSRFRTAVVLEGSFARYVRGASTDPYHAVFETRVPRLLEGAAEVIGV